MAGNPVSDLLDDPVLEIPAMSTAPRPTLSVEQEPADSSLKSGQGPAPLVAIVGPTATGKSALGIWLARRFGGEIIACDSTQVFRGFDIGTAKPLPQEREDVPHHLLDLVDPGFPFTAGEYRLRAVAVLEDLRRRSRLPPIPHVKLVSAPATSQQRIE